MANILDLVKKVKQNFSNSINDDQGWIQQKKFTPLRAITNNWSDSNKATQGLIKAQQFGENFVQNPLPRFKIPETDSRPQKIVKNLANILPEMGNSIFGKGIMAPLTDVAQMGMSRLGGTSPTYDTMRSGAGRLGLQVAGKFNPDTISQYGTKYGVKQVVGNVAETAMPVINAYVPKAGTQIVKQGIKQFTKKGLIEAMKKGFVQGGKLGAVSGLTQSLSNNRNTQDNLEYATSVGLSTVGGAAIGATLGAGLAGLSHGAGYIFNGIKSKIAIKNPKLTSQQVEKEAVKIIKNKAAKPVKWVTDMGSPDLKYNDNTGNWDVDPKWIKKQGGGIDLDAPIKISSEAPTTSTPVLSTATEKLPPVSGEIPPLPNKRTVPQTNVPLVDSTINKYQDIIDALKQAAPLNKEQQQIYAKIRSQKSGALAGIQGSMGGEKGLNQQLSQLKGEMPKVEFTSIKNTFTPERVDSLINEINANTVLQPFEKLSASQEFRNMLEGKVPTKGGLKLLGEVFPQDVIQAVLDKRTTLQKMTSIGMNLINTPRAVMATGDLSAPLRQGIFLIGRPKQWIPAFKDMFKYAFSEKSYTNLGAEIKADPNYSLMRQAKLAITDMSENLTSREEAFMSNLPEKIPVLGQLAKGSNRAYSGFLTKLRQSTFNDLIAGAKKQGVELTDEVVANIGSFVNNATGRGEFRGILTPFNKSSELLNASLFSPRLMAARLNMLDPTYYAKLDPFTRGEALKSLFTFAGTVGTVLTLAKLSGADVGTDPRSADFSKIKVGNTRYDIAGGFSQYLRLGAQLITGKLISSTTGKEFTLGDTETYNPITRKDILIRFFESKEAPALSFMTALMTGKDAIGNVFDLPVQVINRLTPMVAQDAYDLYKERGMEGLIMALPGIFGVGSQTYGKQVPNLETTPAGNPTIKLKPVPGLSETIVNKIRGTSTSNFPLDQQQPLAIKIQGEKQAKVDADKLKKQLESGQVTSTTADQVSSAPDLKTAKLLFEYSPDQYTQVGDSYLYKDSKTNAIKTVDLKIVEKPKLTGDASIDKSLKSKYNSAISTQISGVVDLYSMGALTQEQASQIVNSLTSSKITSGSTKPKAVAKIAQVSVKKPSYKIAMSPKSSKLKGVTIAKRPNLKPVKSATTKIKSIKMDYGKVPVFKITKIKGLTMGAKLG